MNRFEDPLAAPSMRLSALMKQSSATTKRWQSSQISPKRSLIAKPKSRLCGAARKRWQTANNRHRRRLGNAEILTAQRVILPERGLFKHIAATDEARATQRDPAEALYHRACALFERRRFEDALASCEEALASRPDFAEAINQRGLIQQELRDLQEALSSFRKAQKVRPDFVDAHRNELQLYLLAGDFRKAWWKCDQLPKRDPSAPPSRKFAKPSWDGLELLCNKTILVHGDAGHDDTIQFCRYVPLLARRGAHVIVEVEKPLRDLVASVAGVAQVASNEDAPAVFDLHCPLFGLPRAFATTLSTVPATTPYLWPPTQMAAKWERLLAAKKRPWIGFIWSDDAPHVKDRSSIELRTFLKLLDVDATFVCAQRDMSGSDAAHLKARPDILTFGEALSDFSEAAGLLSCLDLLISVDSVMAHLAGALGIPVWVLLQYTPDWRWLIDREDSPWYPTARLFRQRRHDDWNEVVARVAVELQRFVGLRGQEAAPAA
jgi:tetratricopeptide (TPR) repeat protein